jgi:hypothetical protein
MNPALILTVAFFVAALFLKDPGSMDQNRLLLAANIWWAAYWLDSQAKKRTAPR